MGQLEDFRSSLKRKDSAGSSEGEIPVKNIAKAKQEKMKSKNDPLGMPDLLSIMPDRASLTHRTSRRTPSPPDISCNTPSSSPE